MPPYLYHRRCLIHTVPIYTPCQYTHLLNTLIIPTQNSINQTIENILLPATQSMNKYFNKCIHTLQVILSGIKVVSSLLKENGRK